MKIESILQSKIVDLSSLKNFFESDKSALIKVIKIYISDSEPKINKLEENLKSVHHPEIKSIAHFFKSSFSLMGIQCLKEVTELEKLAEKKESAHIIQERLETIIPICKESIEEYKRILRQLEAL